MRFPSFLPSGPRSVLLLPLPLSVFIHSVNYYNLLVTGQNTLQFSLNFPPLQLQNYCFHPPPELNFFSAHKDSSSIGFGSLSLQPNSPPGNFSTFRPLNRNISSSSVYLHIRAYADSVDIYVCN